MKKLSFQKVFCLISVIFIGSCFIFYGSRFIKLYKENKKEEIIEKDSLVKVIKNDNSNNKNYKSINGENYFTNDTNSNYLLYSNIIWRIIKINDDNSITAISDKAVSSLAFGKNQKYEDSYIYKWLNTTEDDYSGILEKSLNETNKYLIKTTTCSDVIDELTNNPCKKTSNNDYITLLSVADYLNIGSKDSYLNNDEYFYLSNTNSDDNVWYVDEDGKVASDDGTEIIGIRPVITIKQNIDYQSGKGTKDNPYTIESTSGLFGSYVKLDNTLWRIYQVNESEVRLMLNDYLKVDGKNLEYKYSNINAYYNDTKYGSIAYYLNNTFLNSLSYKNKLKEVKWTNGYYNAKTDYDYSYSLKYTIDSKVALISIGDIIVNPDLNDYFTMTGNSTNNQGYMVYAIDQSKNLTAKQMSSELNVVPTISIDTSLLTKGKGTYDAPYEME